MIVIVSKVQQDVMNSIAGLQKVNYYAKKAYVELLVDQVGTLKINILIN